MAAATGTRVRLAAAALGAAGVLFLLYPAVRPWRDESTVSGAEAAMGSGAWIASHLFAMLGFILVPLGLLGLRLVVSRTGAEPLALAAAVTAWLGAGLTLPYYGAETFGLNAVAGQGATPAGSGDLLDVVEAVRFGPVAVTTFGAGLLLLGLGAVLAAVAIWRSGVLPRAGGVPLALGFVLFIPQFYAPAEVRIGHGVLMAAGAVWLAALLWRSRRAAPDES